MKLCKEMDNVPKKDNCFYLTAQDFATVDIKKAKQLCDEIQDKKDNCLKEAEEIFNQHNQ